MYGMSLAVALLMAAPPTPPDPKIELLPLAELRPGMRGVGRTVFEGTRIDEFDVEILGVLENTAPSERVSSPA